METWQSKFDALENRRPMSSDAHEGHNRAFVRRKCRGGVVQGYEVCLDCKCFVRGPLRRSKAPCNLDPMTMKEIAKWLGVPGRMTKSARFKSEWKRLYTQYLNSPEWRRKRREVFVDRDGLCEICGESAEQVHHLNYDRLGGELMTDLMAICEGCHRREHAKN